MRKLIILVFITAPVFLFAQDGTITDKKPMTIPDSVWARLSKRDATFTQKIKDGVNFYRITYMSDGLKVTGFIAEPKTVGKYPCIISNRGGNRDFGQWSPISIVYFMGQMASWNYLVVASQYRGNDGGGGVEEFGGKDVDDVLNLVPVLEKLPNADTSRIGMEGASRGGMMTYLSLKRSCRFKAAVVVAGMADAFVNIRARPEMDKSVFAELVPGYSVNKDSVLKERSAVYWADQLCKTTPILLMQGSSDWRVQPEESFELVLKLYEAKHPIRFILFEGADHSLNEWRIDEFLQAKNFFDYYLRDGKRWPSMDKHGS